MAKFIAEVVLPTPPLGTAIAMIFPIDLMIKMKDRN
jgi:hypothetical protein